MVDQVYDGNYCNFVRQCVVFNIKNRAKNKHIKAVELKPLKQDVILYIIYVTAYIYT